MTGPTAADPLVVWAAVTAAGLVSLRLGRMRALARWVDAAVMTAVAAVMLVESVSPGTLVPSATAGPSLVLTAAAVGSAAFAAQSAAVGLRGLVFGATGSWGAVAAVALAATPATLCLSLSAAAWMVWGETARADNSTRPTLATRRLTLTLAADGPLWVAVCLIASYGLRYSWDELAAAMAGDPTWSLVTLGVWCSAAVRLGLFPLSIWRGRAAALGRGPAAVVGPVLALPAGLVLLERFGPAVAGDPVHSAMTTAVPVSILVLAVVATAQTDLRAAANVIATIAAGLAMLLIGGPLFAWAAAAIVLASAGLLVWAGDRRHDIDWAPNDVVRRLGRRHLYVTDAVELATLPVRGVAQLTRFFDASFVVPAVGGAGRRLLTAVDREFAEDGIASRVMAAVLLAATVAAAAWAAGGGTL